MTNLKMSWFSFFSLTVLTFLTLAPDLSFARAGGGGSFGNRGSRSSSAQPRQAPRYSPPPQSAQPARPYGAAPVTPQPSFGGGGLLRSFGAGVAGGVVGNMLFRGLGGGGGGMGYGGGGGGGGGGIGFLDILLLGGLLYLVYRLFRNRFMAPTNPYAVESNNNSYASTTNESRWSSTPTLVSSNDDLSSQSPLIDKETSLDIFFRVQGAFSKRDLSPIKSMLAPEAESALQGDIEKLKQQHRINKLENIAVRDAVVTEQWAENGQEFATVQFTANVIDYTVDETTQSVVSGSQTDPVKFEEFWTVSRPSGSGPNAWKLSAIQQIQ